MLISVKISFIDSQIDDFYLTVKQKMEKTTKKNTLKNLQ